MSAAQTVRPAVVFSLGFVYNWKIGGYDFMEYMSRPEAFCADRHIGDEEYDPKNTFKGSGDFLTYMSNEEKSDGLFDSTHDLLDEEDKNVYRAYELQSRTEGCPKYYGVMSFDNDFLIEHGLLSPDSKHLNAKRLKELGREGINALIHSNPKFEDSNVYWSAAIHTNTDNVHIHYSICEYHRLEDRRQTTAGQDLIPIASFNKLKSVVANRIIGDEHLKRIKAARDEIRTQLAAKGTREQLAELLNILPDNVLRSSKEQAGYNSRYVKRYQSAIQNVVKNIISSDPELQALANEFDVAVRNGQEIYRRIYGEGSQELYINFIKNRYADLQERLGNEVLHGVRDLYNARREHLSDNDASHRSNIDSPALRSDYEQEQPPMPAASHLSDDPIGSPWDWAYQEQGYPDATETYDPSDSDLDFLASLEVENSFSTSPTDARAYSPERPLQEHAARVHQSEKSAAGGFRLEWSDDYRAAQDIIYDKDSDTADYKQAERLLLSEGNNVLALDALAKLYATDKLEAKNTDLSQDHYRRAFEGWKAIEPTVNEKMHSYVWYRIGKCYCYGLGTEINEKQAAAYFEKAALAGNKYAAFSLANIYYYGKGVEQSYEDAFKWYSAAARKGQPFATYAVAQMYERGEYVPKNIIEASNHYRSALTGLVALEKKQPDDNIRYKIGKMYLDGKGTESQPARAVEYFKLAAKDENSRAQYELGKAYITGHGIDKDADKGLVWLEKAIKQGNTTAQLFLGQQYIKGEHIAKNTRKGIELLTEYHKNSQSDIAAYIISKAYLDESVLDKEQHYKWLTIAADEGNSNAQYKLGKAYMLGQDLPENAVEGLRLLTAAIDNDNDYARLFLGQQYLKGEHIAKNIPKGIELLTDCYARHDADILAYSIGKAYLDPTVNDWEHGCEWLTKAAEKGNQHARLRLGYEYYRREQYEDAAKWYAAAGRQFSSPLPQSKNTVLRSTPYRHRAASIDYTLRAMINEMNKNTARLLREFEYEQAQDEYRMRMNGLGY